MSKLERVVAGIDFSEPGLAAARWTVRHLAGEARVVLCHVVDVAQPPAILRGLLPPVENEVASAVRSSRERLSELAASLGAGVEGVVRTGRPAEQVCREAEENGADLIVAGEHGARRGLWNVIGSTAEHLVRLSRMPVLVTRGDLARAPRRILAPLDHSEYAGPVLRWGGFLARRFGARLVPFHSMSRSYFGTLHITSSTRKADEIEREFRETLRGWLNGLVEECGLGGEVDAVDVAIGDPAYEILAAVKRLDTDLIVIGSRGAGAIAQALLGSVARAVLRGGVDPVLVVPRAD